MLGLLDRGAMGQPARYTGQGAPDTYLANGLTTSLSCFRLPVSHGSCPAPPCGVLVCNRDPQGPALKGKMIIRIVSTRGQTVPWKMALPS